MRGLCSLDGGQLFDVNYVRQSPESGMAKLRASMSVEEFDDGYFHAADLKAFARQPGIAVGRRDAEPWSPCPAPSRRPPLSVASLTT